MRKMCVLLTVVIGLLAVPATASALNFKPAPGSPITNAAPDDAITAIATGNFNTDIYDDVAAVTSSNKLLVWLTQSDGTFEAAPGSPYPLNIDTTEKYSMWALDMTGDFRDDLVIQSSQFPGTFYSFFNTGNGAFPSDPASSWAVDHTGPPNYRGAAFSSSATLADLTDDGCPDLLVGMFERSFQVGISNCAGGFSRATSVPVQLPTPLTGDFDGFTATAVGDYNGDGDADIALMLRAYSNSAGPRIVYVMNGDSSGLFGTAVAHYDVPGIDNTYLQDIETIRQNGDEYDDLLVLRQEFDYSNTVTSLLGGASGLTPNPAGTLTWPNQGVYTLATSDFNADGAQDFGAALRGDRQLNVALGNGVDSFFWDGPWDLPQIGGVNFFPNDIKTPDLNGDGFPDLVSSSTHTSPQQTQARGIHALLSAPSIGVSRNQVSYPETPVGESNTQTVTIYGYDGPPANLNGNITLIDDSGSFEMSHDCFAALEEDDTCDVDVTFDPQVDGEFSATLKISVPGGDETEIPLNGVTGHEDLAVNPLDGTVWEIPGGSGGTEKTFKVEATGTWPVQVTDIQVYPDFEEDADRWSVIDLNNCEKTLEPGETCEFDVHFGPKLGDTGSTLDGFLVLESANDDLTDLYAELTGKATNSAFDVTPSQIEFDDRAIGTGPSAVKSFLIDPSGDGPTPFYGVELQGDDESSFEITGAENCPEMIPADSSCRFNVTFEPEGELDLKQAQVVILAYNNNGAEYQVNLSGTAVSAEPPPPTPDAVLRLTLKSAKKVKAGKKLLVTATVRNVGNAATLNPVSLKATSPKKTTRTVKGLKIPNVRIGERVTRKFLVPVKKSARGKFRVKVALAYDGHTSSRVSAQTGLVKVLKLKKKRKR